MNFDFELSIRLLHKTFQQLNYYHKLRYFNKYFGIVPFQFPFLSLQETWLTDETQWLLLMDIFHKEAQHRMAIYERSFNDEDGQTITFDIKPASATQRTQLNTYILDLFLSNSDALIQKEAQAYQEKRMSADEIKERISHIKHITNQTHPDHRIPEKRSIKQQFVNIFLNGFVSGDQERKLNIHIRRKFIEIYLYAYGVFLAKRLRNLKQLLNEEEKRIGVSDADGVSSKINLLQKLGIINFLKDRYKEHKNSEAHVLETLCYLLNIQSENRNQISDCIRLAESNTVSSSNSHI